MAKKKSTSNSESKPKESVKKAKKVDFSVIDSIEVAKEYFDKGGYVAEDRNVFYRMDSAINYKKKTGKKYFEVDATK